MYVSFTLKIMHSTWRVHFHIVSRGEVTVELPGEP